MLWDWTFKVFCLIGRLLNEGMTNAVIGTEKTINDNKFNQIWIVRDFQSFTCRFRTKIIEILTPPSHQKISCPRSALFLWNRDQFWVKTNTKKPLKMNRDPNELQISCTIFDFIRILQWVGEDYNHLLIIFLL